MEGGWWGGARNFPEKLEFFFDKPPKFWHGKYGAFFLGQIVYSKTNMNPQQKQDGKELGGDEMKQNIYPVYDAHDTYIIYLYLYLFLYLYLSLSLSLSIYHIVFTSSEMNPQGIGKDVPRIPTYPCGKSRNISPIARGYLWVFSSPRIPSGYMCQGLNSHYFHTIGDGHQSNSRGLYTHYKDSY